MTLRKLPDSFHYSINGVVSSRAVKFIGKLHSTLVDIETRDSWWESLRDEVRANTLRIGADLVLGYRETCSIHGDICLLSATGTAVKLDMSLFAAALTCRKQRDPKHRGAKNRPGRCPCEAVGLSVLSHADPRGLHQAPHALPQHEARSLSPLQAETRALRGPEHHGDPCRAGDGGDASVHPVLRDGGQV